MGISLDEAKEKVDEEKNKWGKLQQSTRYAKNPGRALEDVVEGDDDVYEGELFTADDVSGYIGKELGNAEEENPSTDGAADEMFSKQALRKYVSGSGSHAGFDRYVKEELINSDKVRSVSIDGKDYFTTEEKYQKLKEDS